MKNIEIGVAYESEMVSVSDEQTVKEVYEEHGKTQMLGATYTLNVLRANQRSLVLLDANTTIGDLGIADGDSIIASPNHKGAAN